MSLSDTQKQNLEIALPMWRIVLNQFFEHKMAVISLFVILLFAFAGIFAPAISLVTGLDPNTQNVAARYLKPFSTEDLSADKKESAVELWIQNNQDKANELQKSIVDASIINVGESDTLFELASMEKNESLALLEKVQSPHKSEFQKLLNSFTQFHFLGTDEVGRDVFIRLVYAARVSLGVGVLVAIASALIGLLIGSVAGFYGGWIDSALMRITDSLLSLPIIPMLIVVAAIDLQKVPVLNQIIGSGSESIWKLVFILCAFSWMTVARLVRGSILSIREREFVLAAKTLGAKDSTIIISHLFPNVIAPMLVSITLGVGESILFEAALSFLGLGIMPPTPSWGNMLNNAQEVIYQNIWLTILPGLFIILTTVAFNFLGDGLQDAIDPKSIRR